MRQRTANGMTEMIPSVEEKKLELILAHAIDLFENFHRRLAHVESILLVAPDVDAEEVISTMRRDLETIVAANAQLDQLKDGTD